MSLQLLENVKFEKQIFGPPDKDYYDIDKAILPTNRKQNINAQYITNSEEGTFLETVELDNTTNSKNSHRYSANIYTVEEDNPTHLYKNLRLKNPEDIHKIKRIFGEVGGMTFDEVYMEFYTQLQQFYGMSGIPLYFFKHGLPSVKHYSANIDVELINPEDDNISLLVDKYTVDSLVDLTEWSIYQSRYFGEHTDYLPINCNNNFNLPTYLLIANQKLTNIRLVLGEDSYPLVQEADLTIKLTNTLNSNDFTNYCINFSSITSLLKYDCVDSTDVKFCTINSQRMQYASGMVAPKYCS